MSRGQRTEDSGQQTADSKQCEEDQARESETRAPLGDAWLLAKSVWRTIRGEDDRGRKWTPQSVEHARTKIMTTMWDREQQTARRNGFGDIVALNEDGWKRRQTLGSLSVFRGKADFTFYQRDLMHRDVRSLKLTVSRPGEAFEFTWRFADHVASAD